jgi:hypothetical protein
MARAVNAARLAISTLAPAASLTVRDDVIRASFKE